MSPGVKLHLENLPASLRNQTDVLRQCLEAFNRVRPIQAVYLFGSHARGDARSDSDVDLCIVAEGAERQFETAAQFRRALREVHPKPAMTLIPIAPARLAEKQACRDHFFQTVLGEGKLLAAQN